VGKDECASSSPCKYGASALQPSSSRNGFAVILRCERSEPRRMGHVPYSSFEARKSAHLRMTETCEHTPKTKTAGSFDPAASNSDPPM